MSEVFFWMAESKMVELKMAAIMKLSENEWMKFFLFKMAESKMAEFKMADHLKINQIELVWVRFRVEWECFWVNLREDNKVS